MTSTLVRVRLDRAGPERAYTYRVNGPVKVGDRVVVPASEFSDGPMMGTVVAIGSPGWALAARTARVVK